MLWYFLEWLIEDGVEPSVTRENLGIFRHFQEVLGYLGIFLENLGIFRDFLENFGIFKDYQKGLGYLGSFRKFLGYLGIFRNFLGYLEIFGGIFREKTVKFWIDFQSIFWDISFQAQRVLIIIDRYVFQEGEQGSITYSLFQAFRQWGRGKED